MSTKHYLTAILIFTANLFSGFFVAAQNISDTLPLEQSIKLPELRLGAHIGYGYRFINYSDYIFNSSSKKYMLKLKSALSFGVDMSHFYHKYIGFGLKYNAFYSKSEYKEPNELPDGTFQIFPFSQKTWAHFFCVFAAGRYFVVPNKHYLFANVGAGYVRMRSKAVLFSGYSDEKVYHDNNAALMIEIGYDFLATKSFAVGLQVSTYISLLDNLGLWGHENVGHFDITVGLRYFK